MKLFLAKLIKEAADSSDLRQPNEDNPVAEIIEKGAEYIEAEELVGVRRQHWQLERHNKDVRAQLCQLSIGQKEAISDGT